MSSRACGSPAWRITIPVLLYRASVYARSAKEKPMRKGFLMFTFCCVFSSATLAQYDKPAEPADSSQAAKPDFSMTASYIEACSCDMFCPCYFHNARRQTILPGQPSAEGGHRLLQVHQARWRKGVGVNRSRQ